MNDTVSPYIDIIEVGTSPSGKTKVWHVVNKRDPEHDIPGVIKWSGAWRKYVYHSELAFYDSVCLRQIADFMSEQTVLHRAIKDLER